MGFRRIVLTALALPLLAAHVLFAQQDGEAPAATLRLRTGNVAPVASNDLLPVIQTFDANTRYVVQLAGPMTPDWRAALIAAGVRLGDYLPDHAYVARLDGVEPQALRGLPFVRWVGRFEPMWKIDPQIGRRVPRSAARRALAAQARVRVIVASFDGVDAADFRAALQPTGQLIGDAGRLGRHWTQIVDMPRDRVGELAALPSVQYVEEAPEFQLHNPTNTWIVQSNIDNHIPLWDHGLHGQEQIGGIIDTRIKEAHCAFDDPDGDSPGPNHRKIQAYYGTGSVQDHGTHTAGTFAGDWAPTGGDECFNGMAWAARLVFRDLGQIYDTISLYDAYEVAHNDGARVHSDSWGDPNTTDYNITAVDIDTFLHDYDDDLEIRSVDNGTVGTITNPCNAKNLLAVGACKDTPNQHQHSSGKSGPTTDGRRKPEVYAPGQLTQSARHNTDCDDIAFSGTSMATPTVAGMGLLVRQYFLDGFYPSGAANPADGFTPSGALIKAALVNSAVDMTGVTNYPTNKEGWGRILLDEALYLSGDTRAMFAYDLRNSIGMETGNEDVFEILNLSDTQRLKITMVFTDVPGTLNSEAPVVNDLNLEVTAPNGNIFKGNVFNTTTGQSQTGGSFDALNNVEQVHRNAPGEGVYVIKIKAAAVNDGPQGYALVVSGDFVMPVPVIHVAPDTSIPELIEAGSPAVIDLNIQSGSEELAVDSPMLNYRFVPEGGSGGAFTSIAMESLGANLYRATLPAGTCTDTAEFYFSAESTIGTMVTWPDGAPANLFSADVLGSTVVLQDDFELDQGWTVEANGSAGNFERGDPELTSQCGREVQPENDHSDDPCGTLCYVTGAAAGANFEDNDLDGGATRLISPELDLSAFEAAVVAAEIWLYDGYLPDDDVKVHASADGGGNWTLVDTIAHGRSEWQHVEFRADEHVALTSQFQVRFTTNDLGENSALEVLVDDVRVSGWGCLAATCLKADVNSDGLRDGDDIAAFIAALDTECPNLLTPGQRCAADINDDGVVDVDDLPGFVSCLTSPESCP